MSVYSVLYLYMELEKYKVSFKGIILLNFDIVENQLGQQGNPTPACKLKPQTCDWSWEIGLAASYPPAWS